MERISASIRLGAVVLGSALLGACASSYQQGSTSSPAVTTVNGPVTSSTGTAAYHQQVLQARDNKTAACLQTEVSSGKLLYNSLVVPSGSFQIQSLELKLIFLLYGKDFLFKYFLPISL